LAVLAILEADARGAARLSTALGGEHEVVVRATWEALHRVLGREPFDGCLVDADHPDRAGAIREITTLRERYPALAIIACVDAGYDLGYYDLGGLGVAGIIACRNQPRSEIRAAVDRALATSRADRIARSLEGRFAPPGPDAIGWAVEHAGADTSVDKLAAALGHTPRSLRQALEDAGLPAPTRVLLWGRLLLAGARLARDGRTVEDVAFSLGYSTATSLARAMKSQTGLTPGEVSEEGGMERVRDALFPEERDRQQTRDRLGRIASLLLLATLAGCATLGGVGSGGTDRGAIDGLLDAPPLGRMHVGVLAVDERTGRTLYARNADGWFVPASNQKILVTAAAWSLLGPDYRYRTELHATGPVVDGRLEGDLVLLGWGDPSLSSRYWTSGVEALEALADTVRARGIREVAGALVVDVAAWDSTTVLPTREVDDLVYRAGATGGAFAIDEGELTVIVRGSEQVGAPAIVEWTPRGPGDYVHVRVETVPPDSSARVVARYLPETRRIVLDGSVRAGVTDTLAFAQRDPVRLAAYELAEALARAGVTVDGGWRVRWDATDTSGVAAADSTGGTPTGARGPGCRGAGARRGPDACHPSEAVVAALESPPLAELVGGVLEPSQNWMAEQLVSTLGAELGDRGGLAQGLDVVRRFVRDVVGVEALDVRPRDGSGLSAYNLVTPRALVAVLRRMLARSDGAAYRDAMASPAEEDSTLEERLGGLEGRVFAKTGTISNVNSLSGYLVREDSHLVVFSILTNAGGVGADQVRAAIDDIVRILAR
jgi:D-alanyl-D-alanine carboxypeptidase/D-alanyl-D-alanine-endopeptidase (penicillin-binding protein 4)